MINRPNLFIVGAPKSGTSALAAYLDEHPNVFICNPKEPFYFCADYPGLRAKQELAIESDYLQLFADANESHQVVGEGSTNYLRSSVAVRNAIEFNPDARFIAMLRNPVEVVHAFHSECLFAFIEREESFEKAWRLQTDRQNGRQLPHDCHAPQFLQYGLVASYADQIEKLFQLVPESQRKVILFEDFRDDNAGIYKETQEFLGLPLFEKSEFQRVNAAHGHRSKLIANLVLDPPRLLKPGVELVRRLMRSGGKNSWMAKIKSSLRKPQQREPLSEQFRDELYDYFRSDVQRLGKLLDRDLTHWTSHEAKPAASSKSQPAALPVVASMPSNPNDFSVNS